MIGPLLSHMDKSRTFRREQPLVTIANIEVGILFTDLKRLLARSVGTVDDRDDTGIGS